MEFSKGMTRWVRPSAEEADEMREAVAVERRGLRHGSNRPVPVSDAIGRRIADELEIVNDDTELRSIPHRVNTDKVAVNYKSM